MDSVYLVVVVFAVVHFTPHVSKNAMNLLHNLSLSKKFAEYVSELAKRRAVEMKSSARTSEV